MSFRMSMAQSSTRLQIFSCLFWSVACPQVRNQMFMLWNFGFLFNIFIFCAFTKSLINAVLYRQDFQSSIWAMSLPPAIIQRILCRVLG